MPRVRLFRAFAAVLVGAVICVSAASAQADRVASARSVGYTALLPGGTQGAVSAVSAGPTERSSRASGLRPSGGGTVNAIDVSVGARVDGREGVAEGSVVISGATMLDGRVSIGGVRMSARASAGPSGATGGLSEASVSGLVVDGQAVAAGPGSRIEVPGVGAIVFLEQVSDGAGGVQANAVRVEVTDPKAAALIGQPLVLGHLELSAVAGTAEPAPPATTEALPSPSTGATAATGPTTAEAPAATPFTTPAPLGLPRRAAPAVALPDGAGYVFPVAGQASFTDEYGAPRAGTGWHHGNDLFAPTGTPLVAVADGTLSKVGVNTLGGNRLWLTDETGNTFYYAHMSAYAPASVEGARVRAGQVIGFVGNTGQAITTPPHLHFEVHPGGGDSVDPYPYLLAWRRGAALSRSFAQAVVSTSPVPAVGAVIVDTVPDIDTPPGGGGGLATPAT